MLQLIPNQIALCVQSKSWNSDSLNSDSIKMVVGNKGAAVAAIGIAKVKTATLMVGIILTLFYNLPFELIPLRVSDFLLAVAAILSVLSGIKYHLRHTALQKIQRNGKRCKARQKV